MRKFRLDVEYDGTDFKGWQRQPGVRTVQGELERACRRLGGGRPRVTGAGRTDAGVHAAGQVASVAVDWRHAPGKLGVALNASLPADMAVLRARAAPAAFDARRDAVERAYRYLIVLGNARPALLRRHALWFKHGLDLGLLRRAAALFKGRHDFSSYSTIGGREKGSVRTLSQVRVRSRGRLVAIDLAGPGFLHRMVRMIMGVLLAAGSRRLMTARIRESLRGESARPLAPAVPARGLSLLWVRYPGERRESFVWPAPGAPCNILEAGLV